MENGETESKLTASKRMVPVNWVYVLWAWGYMQAEGEPRRLGALGTRVKVVWYLGKVTLSAVGLKNDAFSWWGLFLSIILVVESKGQTPSRTTA